MEFFDGHRRTWTASHVPPSKAGRRFRCPGGTTENSPAFQRRDQFRLAQAPQGRLNGGMSYVSSYAHCVIQHQKNADL